MNLPVGPAVSKRVGFLELFFDLVFVFAVTQLVKVLHHDHSAGGWAHAALLLWLIWWAWSQFAWAGNAIDLDHRSTRVAMLAVTGVMLVAAISIPDAFGVSGAWFAVPYAAVRLGGLGLYWFGLRGEPEHRAALRSYLPVAVVSPVLVVVGGLAGEGARPWLWLAAAVVDVVSVAAAGRGEFRVDPGHFAERHGLIVIIALGESVIAVGATAAALETTAGLTATIAAGFAISAVLWWSYFDWVHQAAEHRLASEPDHRRRGHLARDLFTLGHLPIVGGTVVVAAGLEEVLAHPGDPLDSFGALALGLGPALFLLGFVAGNLRATGRLLVERSVAMLLMAVAVPLAGAEIAALASALVVVAVLVGALAVEAVRRAR